MANGKSNGKSKGDGARPSGNQGAAATSSPSQKHISEAMKGEGLSGTLHFAEAHLQNFENGQQELDDNTSDIRKKFDMALGGVIIVNIFWIAIEMDFGPEEGTKVADRIPWFIGSSIFLTIFVVEIFVRLHWEGRRWPCAFWNWFDLVVVICAVLDVWVLAILENQAGSLKVLSILRLARLVRLVRMVKLVKTLHSLYVMVMAFLHALKSMCFLGTIMFFGMLIYAIMATIMIGRNSTFKDVMIYEDTVPDRFGTVYASMYSLFELMTLEGWQLVARPLVEKQPLTFIFIGTFIMIFTYGLLNMVVATVVEKTLVQNAEMNALDERMEIHKLREELQVMQNEAFAADDDASGSLTQDEFSRAYNANENLRSCLERLEVPARQASELFEVLDMDGNKELTIDELVVGIGKLKSGQLSVWDGLATLSIVTSVKGTVTSLEDRVAAIEDRQKEQGEMIKELLMRVRYSLKSPPTSLRSQPRPASHRSTQERPASHRSTRSMHTDKKISFLPPPPPEVAGIVDVAPFSEKPPLVDLSGMSGDVIVTEVTEALSPLRSPLRRPEGNPMEVTLDIAEGSSDAAAPMRLADAVVTERHADVAVADVDVAAIDRGADVIVTEDVVDAHDRLPGVVVTEVSADERGILSQTSAVSVDV
jgi:voltage-gated sodium channel